MREAVNSLSRDGHLDRVGVWLEQESLQDPAPSAPVCLRGMIWEMAGDDTPEEWEKLSLEAPLPHELLASGQSVYQDVGDFQNWTFHRSTKQPAGQMASSAVHATIPQAHLHAMIGPLVGLRHALWTPVIGKGHLLGVILAGTRSRQSSMHRQAAEAVAAELALALEFEQEQRLARERQADVALTRRILAALGSSVSPDTVLSQIAVSCAESRSDASGAGAAFAIIGQCSPGAQGVPVEEMDFAWESGDSAWSGAAEREPLESLWKSAAEARHVVGAEPPAAWRADGVGRLVAIPLLSGWELLGVLVAGISLKASSLATLDRLEVRALLAVSALERRRVRAQQIRRSARQQSLLDLSPEATVLLDARGNIANLNRSARMLLQQVCDKQVPAEQAPALHTLDSAQERSAPASLPLLSWSLGGRFSDLFCARERAAIEAWTTRALAGVRDRFVDIPEASEAELITGARVRLHAPLFASEDLIAVVLSPAAAEESAQQRSRSDAELQNVLEWVEEGILLFGTDHSIRAMNTRFAQIAGLSPQEAVACTTLDSLISRLAERAADPESFARRWRELARGSEGGTREELLLARPVPRVLERSVRPVLDRAGHRLGRVEIYRDLTAQRVFQAKLLQTEKLAAVGQMVTGIAHELSNPLTSILGYSQRLLVGKQPAGGSEEARKIYEEAERASTILRQLLLNAREARPERKRVSLNQVVQRALDLQRFGSAAEKIRIELDLDPTLPFVTGDAGQLQQVLMNLIGNARQAIVQAGNAGTIRLRTARNGERRTILQVIDDGPGIPETILSRIFDPFFTTKPEGVGTGLGLAIVLSVVREHGGQVSVANPPEGGVTFTVELPVEAAEAAQAASFGSDRRFAPSEPVAQLPHGSAMAPRYLQAPAPAPRSIHRGTRVLVVEDEPTVARLIADVLEDEGLHVDVLLDGREALDRAGHEPFDLVICDMKMPGLDGQTFYQSLVQARNPLQERFLFVTGDVIAQQTQEFLERHRLSHVAKPFRVEELTKKVFSLLDGQLAHRGRAAAVRKAN